MGHPISAGCRVERKTINQGLPTNLEVLEEDSGQNLFEPHRPEECVDEDDPAVLGIDEEVSEVDLEAIVLK